ncbi:hypothetical protein [Oceanobacillus manasiensis]|uniref:hypothetical protein n=1 Tax=Oceanobacillus manasiensis TaxID=586413 RepID=UPI0005A8EA6E|nr:hypothetical protein [Oceanobacillus manasiensis]
MEYIYKIEKNYRHLKTAAFIFFFAYSILFVLLGRVLFGVDETIAILILTVALLPFILMLNEMKGRNINIIALIIPGVIMILGKIMYAIILDPLATLDATRYYVQVAQYQHNFDQFLDFFWASFTTDYLMMSSYPSFGIVYLPMYILFNTDSPLLIVLFNSTNLILISYFSYLITKRHFWQEVNNTLFSRLIIAGLLISPTLMYWSSTFSKDIFSVLLAIISLYFLLDKRYILFFLFLVYSTMLRPYSIVIIAIYYVFYRGSKKLMWMGVLGSTAVVAYYVGVKGVVNIFNTLAYLIASPNPFSLVNWDRFFLLEVEILILLGGLALSFYVFINDKQSRKFYLLALGGLYIYSCVMTLLGFGVIDGREQSYSLGSVGDDMSRKKLPIIVLYYTVISYTIVRLSKKYHW